MKTLHCVCLLTLVVLAACAARSAEIEAVDVPVVDVLDDVEGRWSLRLLSPGGQGLRMGFRFGATDSEGWFPVDVDFVFSGDVGLDPARFEGRGRVTDDGLATVLLWQAGDPGAVEFQAEGVLDGNEIYLRHLVWGSHDYLADRDWRMVRTHGAPASPNCLPARRPGFALTHTILRASVRSDRKKKHQRHPPADRSYWQGQRASAQHREDRIR